MVCVSVGGRKVDGVGVIRGTSKASLRYGYLLLHKPTL